MNRNMTKVLEVCRGNGNDSILLNGDSIITCLEGPFERPLIQTVDLTDMTIVVNTVAPFKAEEESFLDVAMFMTDINPTISMGSFYVDKGEGIIGFRSGVYFGKRAFDEDEFSYHIDMGVYAFKRYGRQIESLARSDIPVKDDTGGVMYR